MKSSTTSIRCIGSSSHSLQSLTSSRISSLFPLTSPTDLTTVATPSISAFAYTAIPNATLLTSPKR